MENAQETGQDKVKKICEVLRKETLEPAMEEAQKTLADAKAKAEEFLQAAREKASGILSEAQASVDKERQVFEASLKSAARQVVETLKQEIEDRLITRDLSGMIAKGGATPEVIVKMIEAIVGAVRDEGIEGDLSAVVPSAVSAEKINELLGKELLKELKEGGVLIGPMKGGIVIKLHDENIKIDLSEGALLDLLLPFVRKDLRKYFFADAG